MTKSQKPVARRIPPTQLIISEDSKATLRARLDSEEGQRCLDELATVIAQWAAKAMPMELLEALGSREDLVTLNELWPDIVNAFFKAHSSLAPRK